MAVMAGPRESLEEVPAHVWKGLPACVSLSPSAVNHSRMGVWATQAIPKGRRFGPFVGEKKKRSQVTSNVYMWEVYFPSRGWMCVDAADPMKGNWLRYVNWARSREEQNLFPLEINKAIYYRALRPIGPGEELLVWYTVEDNPEITAALEEERTNSLSRKNSPRAKRARRKLLEKSKQAGLCGFEKASGARPIVEEMWEEGGGEVKKEDDKSVGGTSQGHEVHLKEETDNKGGQNMSAALKDKGTWEEEEEEEEDDGEESLVNQTPQQLKADDSAQSKELETPQKCSDKGLPNTQGKLKHNSAAEHEQELDPDFEPDCELGGDPLAESYSCNQCERRFSTKQGLERHAHIHGVNHQQAQLFKCQFCNKSFGSQVGRRRHERRHEGWSKKKQASLATASNILGPVVQVDSSTDRISPTTHYIAIGSHYAGGNLQSPEMQRKELGAGGDRSLTLEENGESKELHPCKYCNKAFGTHTNMRRHQRRIHERHLLPKGVRRKGMLFKDASMQRRPGESPGTSPPPVYLPSADTEDEADQDDYAVDISKNISENLSFYIDGKIVSTSAVSGCDVIEVDSRSAALFGLDTVIISPNQLSQALKVEARSSVSKQVSSSGLPVARRRTSTPPLVTGLKVETEAAPSPSSSTSSSSKLLVEGIFQQSTDSATFQREKTVYLSPKLKQLLQTQDFQKSTIALLTDGHRLTSPLSVTPLQGSSSKFKRRTSSPPASPQLSPAGKLESSKGDVVSAHVLKVPKLESLGVAPVEDYQIKDDGDVLSSSASHSSSGGGGNACNQQPLDLSNSISRRPDGVSKVLGDSALDLSVHCKTPAEPELKGNSAPPSLIKKRKPNTSMLEKVLMNDYTSHTLPAEEGPFSLGNLSCMSSCSSNITPESAHPSPPALTPVTMNPSSPGASSVTSPTPPPPVLPTIPSPPAMPCSPLSQPPDSPAQRPLPVLSPKMSPRLVEPSKDQDNKDGDETHISDALDSPNSLPEFPLNCSVMPSSPQTKAVDLPSPGAVSVFVNGNSGVNAETETNLKSELTQLSSSSPTPPASVSRESSSPAVSQSLPQIKVKEEPRQGEEDSSIENESAQDSVESALPSHSDKTLDTEALDSTYRKTFVCNVCEQPFDSMKELSAHITEHAADWPYKCEFCVQLFGEAAALLAHRSTLHGVGQIFVCSVCSKEFAFLCNLQQHQKDLHPNESCSHTTVESGRLRPHNYTDPSRAKEESRPSTPAPDVADESAPQDDAVLTKGEPDVNGNNSEDPNEELYTTIKIMASEGGKPKGPDVRLGMNQHYPSYKPPPFPYHSRSHAGSVASATNFTTHNIPQTFSTAIRCTKCGYSFDNMPELHQHILACANASDKKRYTPKKNPIPLKQIVKSPNGVASPAVAAAGQSAFRRMGQPKRLNFSQDAVKTKMSALSKKRNQLVQKAISQRNKAATTAKKSLVKAEPEQGANICPHCSREFTYTASLTKHMAVSCPRKPSAKKAKRGVVEVKKEVVPVLDKNTNRKKSSNGEVQPEQDVKPLGKTRARSSAPTEPEPSQEDKKKAAATVSRLKRSTRPPEPVSPIKRSKKGSAKSPHPTPAAADAPTESAQRPAARSQRPTSAKEAASKKSAETKSPPQPQQIKKEERFSLRMRERMGGPVTRSSQMANTLPPAEVKGEDTPAQETNNSQEVPTK